jgi:flagellar motor component MotA
MTDINQLGPASSIALLAVFYGYFVKWMVMAAVENNES